MRWTYRVVPWHSDSTWGGRGGVDALSAMLTDMGVKGWELAVNANGSADVDYLVFKRPGPVQADAL
jgi:hypothetical protein